LARRLVAPKRSGGGSRLAGHGSPVTARRSRLAGHGSPVTARRFSGEGRGGRFFQFSSFFWNTAPAAGNVPQSKTSRSFPESRHSFPKTCRHFPSRNGSFAKSSRSWTERSRSFWESSRSWTESRRYFPSGNRCFPAFFRHNHLFLRILPVLGRGRQHLGLRCLGLRREAKRHAAFVRAASSYQSKISRPPESGVAAALCHRSPKPRGSFMPDSQNPATEFIKPLS
jgi:hypothetical protein